jgi:hypothetical protein
MLQLLAWHTMMPVCNMHERQSAVHEGMNSTAAKDSADVIVTAFVRYVR